MELFTTDKLIGSENWVRWKWMAEGLLMEKENAYEVCSGEIVKPDPVPNDTTDTGALTKYNSDLAKFDKGNRAARGIFSRTLDARICDLVSMCKSAREIWIKLHELFEQKNPQAQYACQLKFSSFTRDPTDTMAMHIAKLERLVARMSDLDIKPNDFVIMSKLLETLPSDFEPLKMAWCTRSEQQQTLAELKKLLVSEEQRRSSESCRESELSALLAKSSLGRAHGVTEKFDKPVNKQGKQFKCYNCGKRGHVKRNCTLKKNSMRDRKPKEEVFISECLAAGNDDTWVIDSGATQHITNRSDYFQSYTEYKCPVEVRVGNSSTMKAYGHGKISVKMLVHGIWKNSVMENVLYAPEVSRNLFSVSQALDHGSKFNMSNDKCEFTKPTGVVAVGIRQGNLFRLLCKVILPEVNNPTSVTECMSEVQLNEMNSLQLWHERLGHLNKQHVKKFLHSQGIDVQNDNTFCEACVLGKQHRLPFQSRQQRAKDVGEIIHTDVCGPMEEESMGGALYFVCFTDDYSRYKRVYFLKHKSEVVDKFAEFSDFFKNQTQKPIKAVLSDGGLEYNNKDFKGILKKIGAEFRYSTPYTPQQNGSAERNNRTLVELARSIMIAKDLPKSLWAEIVNAVVHILNRAGTSAVEGKSPFEIFYGKSPRVNHLKILGTECFVHTPKQKHKKWDPKSRKGILVGYLDDVDGYRVWFKGTRKIERTRDVVFSHESASTTAVIGIQSTTPLKQPEFDDISNIECTETEFDLDDTLKDTQNIRQLRDRKQLKPPERLIELCIAEIVEPEHYYEAMKSENASEWQAAMDEEIKSLSDNNTWYLTDLPEGRRAIANKWVYKVKYHANGDVDRYKARLVVKGFSQRKGIDYCETYSPVARFETIRALISVAANENLELTQFDVKTAFLYGSLEEEIYMKQPQGYDDNSGQVCRLVKSLYGLKQSPRCWNKRFKEFLEKYGLKESKADPCLFSSNDKNQKLLLALHVDDGLVATTPQIKKHFLEELQHEFKVTYKDAEYYLGLEIRKLRSGDIALSQKNYAIKVLERFNMKDANPVSTPMEKGSLSGEDSVEFNSEKVPYRQAVGSLMYMAIATRPDISFAVSYCSQFLDKAEQKHWLIVKRILKYIKGTCDFSLVFKSDFQSGTLEAYSDADYASDTTTRKSVSGIVCKYSGGAICWASRRQQSVALSTTEAEFVAAAEATKEIIWLKRLFDDIAPLNTIPTLQVDNASAVRLARNPEFHQRTKHIDIKYHFVRDKFLSGEINVEHVDGEHQLADILTKALPKPRFEGLRKVLGVIKLTEL